MKTYRVELASLGTVLVEADATLERDGSLIFIRNGDVFASYALATVKRYEEMQISSAAAPPPKEKSTS